jgi:hypothetical protein
MTSRSLHDANVRNNASRVAVTAKLKKVESTAANESLVPEYFSREETMIAEHASCPGQERRDAPDRRLRNRIIVANLIAWIAIIALIGLIFF